MKSRDCGEPADRAAEMRAVDREDLELLAVEPAHPARDVGRGPVPRPRGTGSRRWPAASGPRGSSASGPRLIQACSARRRTGPTRYPTTGIADQRGRDPVQRKAQREQEAAARGRRRRDVGTESVRLHMGVTSLVRWDVASGPGPGGSLPRTSRPGTGCRCAASQATTSVISSGVSGCPGGNRSPVRHGPDRAVPQSPCVRSDWSLTSAR